ncbi:Glutaredoxin family protein [Thalictrum thalictroides]|uniref:Glutaredoxin family protein n=1 Tax=Thalictrum thalictroides TaxID=46969 RepID=A0A7J6WRD9_THATH|nr:Glutaredoxin family protein [Thalictrum thalictroides]
MLEMKIPVMDPPNPFPYAQLFSTSSSPEVSPRFKASPSIELSFHEKRSLVEKSQSGGEHDNYMELHWRLRSFDGNCPPGGENSVVLYTTAGWHRQDRLTECNYVRSILKSDQVEIIEREISANSAYWVELRKLLWRTEVPALFVHGKFVGGINEVKSLEEEGKLKLLLYALPVEKQWLDLIKRNWDSFYKSSKGLHFTKISRRRSI